MVKIKNFQKTPQDNAWWLFKCTTLYFLLEKMLVRREKTSSRIYPHCFKVYRWYNVCSKEWRDKKDIQEWNSRQSRCWMLTFETKIDPSRLEQLFKRRTWLEEQVLLYITWTGSARILNMSEFQCGQICLDMCNFVNMPEYAWNITCLNKPEF